MGSPLFPLLCDIYVLYFEEELFSVHKFPHWFRYVADTSVLVPFNTDFSSLLSLVSLIHSCIQFTLEVENNSSLSFLDDSVFEHIHPFSTTVFRKSLSVSLLPHCLSNHLFVQKMAVIYTYVYPSLHICSYLSNLCNELNNLKSLALSRS